MANGKAETIITQQREIRGMLYPDSVGLQMIEQGQVVAEVWIGMTGIPDIVEWLNHAKQLLEERPIEEE